MKHELVIRHWATLVYASLLLGNCHTLLMALCVSRSRHFRSSSRALPSQKAVLGWVSSSPVSGMTAPPTCRRKSLRRRRAAEKMLHSKSYDGPSYTVSPSKLRPLPTTMDMVLPFGRCIGVALPDALTADVLRAAEEELLPEEMSYCLRLPETLQLGFMGGRLAIRRALKGMQGAAAAATSLAILHNKEGAPLLPDGVSASISHKRHMALALVQTGSDGHLGVDIELPGVQRRLDLRRRVLTPRECENLGGVAGVTEQEEVLLRFSIKEAVYKAAHPFLHRPLGFKDVEVQPMAGGGCEVHTSTEGAWGDLQLSAGWVHFPDVLGQPLFLSYCKAIDGARPSDTSSTSRGR